VLGRLADSADVLIENMRPPVKHRPGFDYDTMHTRNPRLAALMQKSALLEITVAGISHPGRDHSYGTTVHPVAISCHLHLPVGETVVPVWAYHPAPIVASRTYGGPAMSGLVAVPCVDTVPGLGEAEDLLEVWGAEELAIGIGKRHQRRGPG
jgi:hypothetical protein